MYPALSIETLGHVNISSDGVIINDLLSARAKALIVYLATTRYEYLRTEISSVFLNEFECPTNFRRIIHEIRKALPNIVLITKHTVTINSAIDCWMDATFLEERLPRLCQIPQNKLTVEHIATMQSLVSLYKGEFLAGLLVDTIEFEFWRNIFAQNLEALIICALDHIVNYYLHEKNYPIAMQRARDLLQLDPYRSESYRKMMITLVLMNQRRAAIETYDTCVSKLARGMDMKPSCETIQLFEEIKSGEFTFSELME